MTDAVFAGLPEPPYYAVIFSSLRNADDEAGYAAAAQRMLDLAAQQPGFLGAESARGTDGFGITVSYWASERDISAWKHQAEHAATRAHGRRHWYEHFELRVAKVERAYGKPSRA
jgi:heme-degrading monooxygenase HmoA